MSFFFLGRSIFARSPGWVRSMPIALMSPTILLPPSSTLATCPAGGCGPSGAGAAVEPGGGATAAGTPGATPASAVVAPLAPAVAGAGAPPPHAANVAARNVLAPNHFLMAAEATPFPQLSRVRDSLRISEAASRVPPQRSHGG